MSAYEHRKEWSFLSRVVKSLVQVFLPKSIGHNIKLLPIVNKSIVQVCLPMSEHRAEGNDKIG